MQSEYAEHFEREMGCTPAEWLRWLPGAVGDHRWNCAQDSAAIALGSGQLQLLWRVGEPRVIALVRLPRLYVGFRFTGVDADQRALFMRRFDLYMQRGGG